MTHASNRRFRKPLALTMLLGGTLTACAHHHAPSAASRDRGASDGSSGLPLVLSAEDGEHRVRRIGGVSQFTIKVDPAVAHSRDLVMLTETIPPNGRIPAHVHPSEDEIIFVHGGSGTAELGDRRAVVTTGATVYIPRGTRISLRNSGEVPLEIVAIFSHPGFEAYLRDTSAPAGEAAAPLTSAELTAVRERHAAHVVWERP